LFVIAAPFVVCIDLIGDTQGRAKDGTLAIQWQKGSDRIVVDITGLDARQLKELARAKWEAARWQQLLAVYAEQGDAARDPWLPAMAGTYCVHNAALRFESQFPPQAGVQYRAVFRPEGLPRANGVKSLSLSSTFRVPPRISVPSTVVKAVFPSADALPENLLKFYVHFSAPMSRGHIYDHIHLLDSGGQPVRLPFLELDEELWDAPMTRLTLLIDPGRIKRGVAPLEELGPVLETGKRFALIIDKSWPDANGDPLKAEFRKEFAVAPADREPPDPARWAIVAPKAGTRDALTARFNEPMDHALARRVIQPVDAKGKALSGEVTLAEHEQLWTFVPEKSWGPGSYRLSVQTTIEDLAGNNIGKPFEVDLFEGVKRRFTNSTVNVPFEIR